MAFSLPLFFSPFLLLFLLPTNLATAANIATPSSLSTNDGNSSWTSPSGDFAFGFRKLNNSDFFLLAIWYDKIPEKTIVWHANGNNTAPSGSILMLTQNGISLNTPEGRSIWSSRSSGIVSHASMLDTGNFVLSSKDHVLWQSFQYPTDTILPTQVLDIGTRLYSRISESNFSRGRFFLELSNTSLQLKVTGWPSESVYKDYYLFPTYSLNPSEYLRQFVFNETGRLYLEKVNRGILDLDGWVTINYSGTDYYRAILGFDGVFILYGHAKSPEDNQGWSRFISIPDNICDDLPAKFGSGACGYNSFCTLQDGRPTCKCAVSQFKLVDPNNMFSDCEPNYLQGCGEADKTRDPEDLYKIVRLDNVNWPFGDYERLESYNETQCEKSCLNDCLCAAAVFGRTACWKKRFPLSNGKYEPKFVRSLFKVRKEEVPYGVSDENFGKNEKRVKLIGAVLLSCSVFFSTLLIIYVVLLVWRKRRCVYKNIQDSSSLSETHLSLRNFSYKQLEEATDGFEEELGRGSFAIVYKGVLKSGSRNVIAVKKLDKLALERDRELKTEITAIGRTHHKNLVQLLGFCDEGPNRLLVYEFMSNGTLANLLFSYPRPDWNMRAKIALDTAKGLAYLHEECSAPIIHCDIKPQNILLDEHFVAKISDFGLSKLLLPDQSRTHTLIRGTRGYVAPEWFKNVAVTAKVDVYSFGVMLLEIICCRRSVEMELEEEQKAILTDWVYDCYMEGKLDVLTDNDEAAMNDTERMQRWLKVAMWCIQDDPCVRPTMKIVMQMLEGVVEVRQPPCPSSFSTVVPHQTTTPGEHSLL